MVADLTEVLSGFAEPTIIIGAALDGLTGLVLAGERPASVRAPVLVDADSRIEPAAARPRSRTASRAASAHRRMTEARRHRVGIETRHLPGRETLQRSTAPPTGSRIRSTVD